MNEQPGINVSPQDLLTLIGDKEVQLVVLRNQLQQAQQIIQAQSAQIQELTPKDAGVLREGEDPGPDSPDPEPNPEPTPITAARGTPD